MPLVDVQDFQLNYEVTIERDGPTLLLVPGLGEQIGAASYPVKQCEYFAAKGFRVVRMENRDSGLSQPTIEESSIAPYTLYDLADDVGSVISAIGSPVHLVGSSLGGYIVRWAAIRHPELVKSLTVVMSGSGASHPDEGPVLSQEVSKRLLEYTERRTRDEYIAWNLETWRWLWGNGYPFPQQWIQDMLEYTHDRSYRPEGNARLLNAVRTTPAGLWEKQSQIKCPTLVMHGEEDPTFTGEHGIAIAKQIHGSQLWLDPRMGHIMHEEQWPEMADRVAELAAINNKPDPA